MSKTLFMIHGMWVTGDAWEHYRSFFEDKGYTCITPTLRHHDVDPSDPPPDALGTTSLRDYADDLEEQINALPEPPIIIGHSMGGFLAQELASRGLGKAVVLLTPAAPAGILAVTLSVARCFISIHTKWGFWKTPIKQTFKEAVYGSLHKFPPEEQKLIYDEYVYESGQAAAELGFWIFDKHKTTRIDEKSITAPMLIIGGGEDRIVPAKIIRKIAKKYKHVADYKEFSDYSHQVINQPGWEQVAGFVLNWLEDKRL